MSQPPGWVEPALWYSQLPTAHVAALALISDHAGRVLLVKPNYRPHWTLPGGMADDGEPPNETVTREIQEELGMNLAVGHLAVVDWGSPRGERQRPLLTFVFDGGVVDSPPIKLQASELDEWKFVPTDEMADFMPERSAGRISSAAQAVRRHVTILLIDGFEPSS